MRTPIETILQLSMSNRWDANQSQSTYARNTNPSLSSVTMLKRQIDASLMVSFPRRPRIMLLSFLQSLWNRFQVIHSGFSDMPTATLPPPNSSIHDNLTIHLCLTFQTSPTKRIRVMIPPLMTPSPAALSNPGSLVCLPRSRSLPGQPIHEKHKRNRYRHAHGTELQNLLRGKWTCDAEPTKGYDSRNTRDRDLDHHDMCRQLQAGSTFGEVKGLSNGQCDTRFSEMSSKS